MSSTNHLDLLKTKRLEQIDTVLSKKYPQCKKSNLIYTIVGQLKNIYIVVLEQLLDSRNNEKRAGVINKDGALFRTDKALVLLIVSLHKLSFTVHSLTGNSCDFAGDEIMIEYITGQVTESHYDQEINNVRSYGIPYFITLKGARQFFCTPDICDPVTGLNVAFVQNRHRIKVPKYHCNKISNRDSVTYYDTVNHINADTPDYTDDDYDHHYLQLSSNSLKIPCFVPGEPILYNQKGSGFAFNPVLHLIKEHHDTTIYMASIKHKTEFIVYFEPRIPQIIYVI